LDIKSEGQILAYEVTLNSKGYQASQPDWVNSPFTLEEEPSDDQIPEKA
jgi:hypothetical protein